MTINPGLRMQMEKEIKSLIQAHLDDINGCSVSGTDYVSEKLMDYFEDNAIYITGSS
jgi:hypothetical protein